MWQYANVPIGCAPMPHGNWHIVIFCILAHYVVSAKIASFFGTFIHSFRFIIHLNENYLK